MTITERERGGEGMGGGGVHMGTMTEQGGDERPGADDRQ